MQHCAMNRVYFKVGKEKLDAGKLKVNKTNITDVVAKKPNCPSGEVGEADACDVYD